MGALAALENGGMDAAIAGWPQRNLCSSHRFLSNIGLHCPSAAQVIRDGTVYTERGNMYSEF